MSFAESVKSVLSQYVGFSGRARRSEYWWFYLFTVIVVGVPYLIAVATAGAGALTDSQASMDPLTGLLIGLVGLISLALFLPTLAVVVRRLHDTGRSGWWYLIVLVPFVGGIVLLVFMVLDSEPGPNRFGPNPKNLQAGYGQGYQQGYGQGYGTAPQG